MKKKEGGQKKISIKYSNTVNFLNTKKMSIMITVIENSDPLHVSLNHTHIQYERLIINLE